MIVAANFYGRDYEWKKAPELEGFEKILGNYKETEVTAEGAMKMKPYEAAVYYK